MSERNEVVPTHLGRYALGALISAAAIVLTLQRVDAGSVLAVLSTVEPLPVAVAAGFVVGEVAVRAVRWRLLLRPLGAVSYPLTLAYLFIGYLANTILPARLGDIARAYLAGTAFSIRRTTVLGTILVERVSDGLLMLLVVLAAGSVVPRAGPLIVMGIWIAVIGAIATAVLIASLSGVRRSRLGRSGAWMLVEAVLERLLEGARAIRSPSGLGVVIASSVAALGLAVVVLIVTARSVGVALTPLEGVLVTAGLALSLSIPAGPGAVGTYEFVGFTILTALGVDPERALAAVVLHHAIVAVPPALAGLIATLVLHVGLGTLAARTSQPLADETHRSGADAR